MVTIDDTPDEVTVVQHADGYIRSAIAGHPHGSIRRIILYGIAIVCIVSPYPYPLAALLPVFLLAVTDQLA